MEINFSISASFKLEAFNTASDSSLLQQQIFVTQPFPFLRGSTAQTGYPFRPALEQDMGQDDNILQLQMLFQHFLIKSSAIFHRSSGFRKKTCLGHMLWQYSGILSMIVSIIFTTSAVLIQHESTFHIFIYLLYIFFFEYALVPIIKHIKISVVQLHYARQALQYCFTQILSCASIIYLRQYQLLPVFVHYRQ